MKSKRIMMSAATLGLAAVLVLTALSPATAAPAAPPPGTSQATAVAVTPAEAAAGAAAAAEIKKYESALTTVNGVVHFNATAAIALGGSATSVEQFAVGIAAGGGSVSGISLPASQVAAAAVVAKTVSHCYGSTNLTHQWFGYQLKINSCITAKILAAGLAVTTVAGILTAALGVTVIGGIIALVVTGIVGLGSAALYYCSSDGDGAIIDFGPVPWCANQ